MEEIKTDVLVIGSGGAGLRAAISAAESGCRTLVVSKTTPVLGSATLLSDGFFGSSGLGMTCADHVRITMETGYGLNNPEMVEVFTKEAPIRLEELTRRGVPFMMDKGGMRAPKIRLGHMSVPHVLEKWAVEAGATLMGWTTVTDLITADGLIVGCTGLSKGHQIAIHTKSIILCSGGASGLFLFHDNPMTNLGDGYALAARVGAVLKDMEFAQFYPFVTSVPGKPRILMTPPLSDGGEIVNDKEEDLIEKYDLGAFRPLGMKARDRLSRALFQEYQSGHPVFLDLRAISEDTWQHPNAGQKLRRFLESRYRCNVSPIPIMPAAHFTMGGVEIDIDGRTSVKGLFAAGELACGLHGANRMGGNALSETLVFGARAGIAAAAWARSVSLANRITVKQPLDAASSGPTPLAIVKRLKEALWKYGGPIRTHDGLIHGIEIVDQIEKERPARHSMAEAALAASIPNCLFTARSILEAALSRRESLGAHYRED
jgi:aspartate oxidase